MMETQALVFALSQFPHALVLTGWYTQQLVTGTQLQLAVRPGGLHLVLTWQVSQA